MEKPAQFESVADAYGGYVSDDQIFVQVTFRCTAAAVDDFVELAGEWMPKRRDVSDNLVPIGAWRTLYGSIGDEITHLYAFDSLRHLHELSTQLRSAGGSESELTSLPPSMREAVREWSTRVMSPLPYCPDGLVREPADTSRDDRMYQQILENMTRAGIGVFIKHYGAGIARREQLSPNLVPVGGWRTLYGAYNEVTHLYAYENLGQMEELRKVLFKDPEHMEHVKVNTSPNPPNNWNVASSSKLMTALPYSRWR
jgi:hypothetical protein